MYYCSDLVKVMLVVLYAVIRTMYGMFFMCFALGSYFHVWSSSKKN